MKMNTFSRRNVLLGGSAAAALFLAACGSASESNGQVGATAGATSGSGSDGGVPTRPFTDSLGRTVNVPDQPKRIVSLHEFSSGRGLLSIGAPVVGLPTREGKFDEEMNDFDLSKIKPVGDAFVYDIEKIAALEPDLIVSGVKDRSGGKVVGDLSVADLESIAPTVYLQQTDPLDEYMAKLGELVGKQDEVARQRKEWDATLTKVKAQYGSKLATLSIAMVGSDEGKYQISSTISPEPLLRVMHLLGVKMPKIAQEGGARNEIYTDVSAEELMKISADIIFYNADDPIVKSPTWSRLPAVRAGQSVAVKKGELRGGANYMSYRADLAYLDRHVSQARADVVDETKW